MATNPAPANANPQQGGGGWNLSSIVTRIVIFYFISQFLFKGSSTPAKDPSTGLAIPPSANLWSPGQRMELRVYGSPNPFLQSFDDNDLLFLETGLAYDYSETNDRYRSRNITIPVSVQHNGTYYAHVYLVKEGFSVDPQSQAGNWDSEAVIHLPVQVVKFAKRPKVHNKINLLTGTPETPVAVSEETAVATTTTAAAYANEIISYWAPNITLQLVYDFSAYTKGAVPPPLSKLLVIDRRTGNYFPVLNLNEFWLMKEHLIPINETTPQLELHLAFSVVSLTRFMLYEQMGQSLEMQKTFGSEESEVDEIKRMLMETNPYLLGITMVVSMLHMVFDFLAFKNDISFWKNAKSMEGLSVKTIFLNVIMQFIIFLYLIDNETSWMIVVSTGIGLLIECWKVRKAVIVTPYLWKGVIPWLKLQDRASYVSRTKEFDDKAMTYLSYLLFPLLIGYAVYSMMYDTHRSWYSFILSTLTGAVYAFGFILMTPQLFINYKLKSVAHLPWRTFMYKALNTFIDDLFAFIIKMPTLHRLSCFRDDLIFVVYLYQRWIYPVDKRRANEFGQVGDASDVGPDAAPDTAAAAAVTAPVAGGGDHVKKE